MADLIKTRVNDRLISTLQNIPVSNDLFHGYLFGQRTVDATLVVGFANIDTENNKGIDETYVESCLAGGLKVCGIVVASKATQPSQGVLNSICSKVISKCFMASLESHVLVCILNDEITSNSFFWLTVDWSSNNFELKPTDAQIDDFDVISKSILTRIKTNVTLTVLSNNGQINLSKEVQKLCTDATCSGSYTFHIDNTSVFLTEDDTIGIKKTSTATALTEVIPTYKSGHCATLSFSVLQRLSSNSIVPSCAPFIQHTVGEDKCFTLDLPIDVLCLIPHDLPIKDVYQLLCQSISRQILAMGSSLNKNKNGDVYHLPEVYHFQPHGTSILLSIVYPRGVVDDNLASNRKKLHEMFCLPLDKPLLRRGNKFITGEQLVGGYLLNPHTHINVSSIKDSKFYLVQGYYAYHHYMQDKFDDNKWGCAYRSLQTLVSWFRLQGYTDKSVPGHKEIQQALVDIGDKDPKFVGSRNWIGSLEVSYCLEHLLGITSKILSVSTGAELANKGRELAQHFTAQGTPIMIGGGVLAHTILGINFSEVSGDIKFLILDPHFTGGENIREIIDKGWCGWKGPDFWDQTAMYNMCLPQRPKMF